MEYVGNACRSLIAAILLGFPAIALAQCPSVPSQCPGGGATPVYTYNSAVLSSITSPRYTLSGATGLSIVLGNQVPLQAAAMKIDWLVQSGSFPLQGYGGIWPGYTYAYFGISKEFTGSSLPAGPASPQSALMVAAHSNGSTYDVVSVLPLAVAHQSNGRVFGFNAIVTSAGGGLTGLHFNNEIDMEPAVGDTVSSGCGLCFNAFNSAMPIAAIQLGGINGGSFANGIGILSGVSSSGAGLFSNGTTMDSLVNSGSSTYATAAIVLSNQHKIAWSGASGTPAFASVDGANNFRLVLPAAPGGGFAFRNNADNTSIVSIDSVGNITGTSFTPDPGSGAAGVFSNGKTMDSLINSGNSTYQTAAIKLSNQHRIAWLSAVGDPAYAYVDSSSNFRMVLPDAGSFSFRNNADLATIASIDSSGNINVASAAYLIAGTKVMGPRITGWGTSTNGVRGAVDGGAATLAQTRAALAQLLIDLATQGTIGP